MWDPDAVMQNNELVDAAIYRSRACKIKWLEQLKNMVGGAIPSNVNRSRSIGMKGITDWKSHTL